MSSIIGRVVSPGWRKTRSIGHPLPGMSVKILDPENEQPLTNDQPGLLFVRGPNVMQGYLGKPKRLLPSCVTAGTTLDIATLDEDGFLRVTDRLSRFSKIGGEMVHT